MTSRLDPCNDAVKRAWAAGVFVSVSAGNENTDACGQSPANAPEVVTVAATTSTDARASYSNYGPCVDVFAPGTDVNAAALAGGYTPMSGTSFAAPLVAGVAALWLQRYPGDSPNTIAKYGISDGASRYKITDPGSGSPNRLLYSNLPIAPMVTVHGPNTVGYMDWNCQWDSYVEGGRPPFTYQWSGSLSGTDSYISGTLTESGHLNLDVWDPEGRHGVGGIWINYDPNVGYYCGV